MRIVKVQEQIEYKISEGDCWIGVTVEDNRALTITTYRGDIKFMFVDSLPEMVNRIGMLLIEASKLLLIKKET